MLAAPRSPSRGANDRLMSEAKDTLSIEKTEGGGRHRGAAVAVLLLRLLLMMKTTRLMMRLSSWITITVTCTLN